MFYYRSGSEFVNVRTEEVMKMEILPEFFIDVFRPANVTRRGDICGYSFMPYAVVNKIMEFSQGSFAFDASDIVVKYSEEDNCPNSRSIFKFKPLSVKFPFEDPTEL
jgi:hypothetical protein